MLDRMVDEHQKKAIGSQPSFLTSGVNLSELARNQSKAMRQDSHFLQEVGNSNAHLLRPPHSLCL
jgi:hypothetical protein